METLFNSKINMKEELIQKIGDELSSLITITEEKTGDIDYNCITISYGIGEEISMGFPKKFTADDMAKNILGKLLGCYIENSF